MSDYLRLAYLRGLTTELPSRSMLRPKNWRTSAEALEAVKPRPQRYFEHAAVAFLSQHLK